MIWINLKALEDQIKNDTLSDKLVFTYLVIEYSSYFILQMVKIPRDNSIVFNFILAVFTLLTLFETYRTNRKGDNKDYFKRLVAVTFIAGVQTIIALVLTVLIIIAFLMPSEPYDLEKNRLASEVIIAIVCLYFSCYKPIMSFRRMNTVD